MPGSEPVRTETAKPRPSLAGRVLGELALHGKTHYPIEPFRLDRPALTDPSYEPVFAM